MSNVYRRLKGWLLGQRATTKIVAADIHSVGGASPIDHEDVQNVVPYDETLLERSRTQWQFGDWESLTLLARDTLQHHPDRAAVLHPHLRHTRSGPYLAPRRPQAGGQRLGDPAGGVQLWGSEGYSVTGLTPWR